MYVRVIVDDVGPPCRCQGPTISVSPRRRVVVAKAFKKKEKVLFQCFEAYSSCIRDALSTQAFLS